MNYIKKVSHYNVKWLNIMVTKSVKYVESGDIYEMK